VHKLAYRWITREGHVECKLVTVDVCEVYRVSQEECARLQESVPYVKLYQ